MSSIPKCKQGELLLNLMSADNSIGIVLENEISTNKFSRGRLIATLYIKGQIHYFIDSELFYINDVYGK